MRDPHKAIGRAKRNADDANVFARNILLPENEFRAEVHKNGNVLRLAQAFRVTTLLIRIRAKELGMGGSGL